MVLGTCRYLLADNSSVLAGRYMRSSCTNILEMKKAIITIILLLFCAAYISAQKVEVSQSFVDDATKSFIEVRALRDLEDARKAEITAKDEQIRLQQQLIDALKIQNNVLLQQNQDLSKLKANKVRFFWGIISITRYK